jgi:hypothetical protein
MARSRQEVLNVILAQILAERGVVAAPESIMQSGGNRIMPDVLVEYQGLRVMIEGEVDSAQAEQKARDSANARVESGVAHIGVAVVYSSHLRQAAFAAMKADLEASTLKIAIVTESGANNFLSGGIEQLEWALRYAFEQLVQEDVVQEAVDAIDAGVEKFASVVTLTSGNIGRLAEVLGIQAIEDDDTSSSKKKSKTTKESEEDQTDKEGE